jgi:hypothetical protein
LPHSVDIQERPFNLVGSPRVCAGGNVRLDIYVQRGQQALVESWILRREPFQDDDGCCREHPDLELLQRVMDGAVVAIQVPMRAPKIQELPGASEHGSSDPGAQFKCLLDFGALDPSAFSGSEVPGQFCRGVLTVRGRLRVVLEHAVVSRGCRIIPKQLARPECLGGGRLDDGAQSVLLTERRLQQGRGV